MRSHHPARSAALFALLTALGIGLVGCSEDTGAEPETAPSSSPTQLPRAKEPKGPEDAQCYRLTYDQAVSPTNGRQASPCDRPHTSETSAVGTLETVVDGHLVAIDSDRVQEQVATTCPEQVATFVGGTVETQRLSMLRPVWFTPTVEQSDAGARWYRCDVVAVATDEQLVELTTSLGGVLDTPEGRDGYGMCGTAAPGTEDFERVVCATEHSWRAIGVVDLPPGDYPGEEAAEAAGQTPCEDAGSAVAEDPLDFQWGYEAPTAEQWADGQTFGRCWAPD